MCPVGVVGACLYDGASGPHGDGAWVEVREGLDAIHGGEAEVVKLKKPFYARPSTDLDLVSREVRAEFGKVVAVVVGFFVAWSSLVRSSCWLILWSPQPLRKRIVEEVQ